jgi:hypothetical protein
VRTLLEALVVDMINLARILVAVDRCHLGDTDNLDGAINIPDPIEIPHCKHSANSNPASHEAEQQEVNGMTKLSEMPETPPQDMGSLSPHVLWDLSRTISKSHDVC